MCERERDRQTDRWTDRQTEMERERKCERESEYLKYVTGVVNLRCVTLVLRPDEEKEKIGPAMPKGSSSAPPPPPPSSLTLKNH